SALPALYLYPLNDSFVPKHIALSTPGQRVKIGRQTNAKTTPGERNGYFDSKVLSRAHAEIWEEGGKIYIKDVKSSNGTFINGERLSQEGMESEPFDLKSDDIVEFGIDIVGEDNKTIVHHKVAARVVCIFNEQDALMAARSEQQHQPNSTSLHQSSLASSSNGQPNMSSLPNPPNGLTFEHILTRLQGELQKSRDTGAELGALTGSMGEIGETLGGTLPPN
ncbi:SMAD/FHA domain-containing protein, partial [Mucidula mucida]